MSGCRCVSGLDKDGRAQIAKLKKGLDAQCLEEQNRTWTATLRAQARPFCLEASCHTNWCSEALSGETIGAGTAGSGPLAARVGCPPRKRACSHCSTPFNPGTCYTACKRCFLHLHVNCVCPHYESAHPDDPVPEHYGGIQSAQTNSNAVAVDDKAVVAGLLDHLAPKRPRPPCDRCDRNAWDYVCAACGRRVCAELCWEPNVKRCWDCIGLPDPLEHFPGGAVWEDPGMGPVAPRLCLSVRGNAGCRVTGRAPPEHNRRRRLANAAAPSAEL